MKKYLFLFGVILVYFLFSSKSCETTEKKSWDLEETALERTRDSIKNEFVSDDLSEKSLRAFEEKAKEKLADFADYLNIDADESLDEAFREQSRQMILNLFISGRTSIKILPSDKVKKDSITVNQLLNTGLKSVYNYNEIYFDSIKISEPLHRTTDFWYTGSLNFSQRMRSVSSRDSSIIVSSHGNIDIIATRVRKMFGNDTLTIWRVFLGKIK